MSWLKSFKIIIAFLLLALLFCGCSKNGGLRNMSVIEGMGIDYEDGKMSVTVQSLNLAKEGSGVEALSGNITMNTTDKSETISEAIEQISQKTSKSLFFGQNKVIIFGKAFAKDYLTDSLDYILRSADSRADVLLAISDSTALDILECEENDALVPAEAIYDLLETGENEGFGAYVTVNELLNMYADKTSDIYLPVLTVEDDSTELKGIAVYSNDELKTVLSAGETFGFLMLTDKLETGQLIFESEKFGRINSEIISSKASLRVSVSGGQVVLSVKIKASVMLEEIENGITSSISKEDIGNIEALANERIAALCTAAFNQCVKNESDCIRIGEALAMYCPADYAVMSKDWHSHLKDCTLQVTVDAAVKKINDNSKGN